LEVGKTSQVRGKSCYSNGSRRNWQNIAAIPAAKEISRTKHKINERSIVKNA
jgi:hypothetical protein